MSKTGNPEKDFKKTPEFSGKSKIIGVTTGDSRRGIILDNMDELKNALFVYDGHSVKGARATQDNLLDEVGKTDRSGMGVGLLLLGGLKMSQGFTEKLVEYASKELQEKGRFHRSFDYDAMGTNFFKTTVECEKVEDKYVLKLNAAYVGDKPEHELAKTLEKQMALISSNVYGKLSVVNDWWFNADFKELLKNLPVSQGQIEKLVNYIAQHGYEERPEISFKHNKNLFNLDIGLDADRYLRPENGEHGSDYFQARGYSLVGGAWTTWNETGNNKTAPRVKNPSLVLYVSFSGDRYSKPPVVEPEKMKLIQNARDYLVDLIHM